MMRCLSIALLAITAGAAEFSRMGSVYGDARLAATKSVFVTNVQFDVSLGDRDCTEFTVTSWMRNTSTNRMWITTEAFWCPENIQYSNPDLLAGKGGFGSQTNLSTAGGAITVASFPWQPYSDAVSSNTWPKGVYTLAGWSSNAVTVTLGGNDVNLGPGEFNRNAIPGPSASVIISGSGLCSIGISRTPDSQFFWQIDGVKEEKAANFTADTVVTNELCFCAWRFRLDATNHLYRSDLIHYDGGHPYGLLKTNDMPRIARIFSRNGIYRVGLAGIGNDPGVPVELFDSRLCPWWLSDAEVLRCFDNGKEEIIRRGIPRWK